MIQARSTVIHQHQATGKCFISRVTCFWVLFLSCTNLTIGLLVLFKRWKEPAYQNTDHKVRNIPNNLDCSEESVQKEILLLHNKLRATVNPPATNMLIMSWHPEAAAQAQKHADRCLFKHNPGSERTVPKLNVCGQNLGQGFISWSSAINAWWEEWHDFNYGVPNDGSKVVGHYTQMAWATSHMIGCGVANCSTGGNILYLFTCHYCPGGNIDGIIQYPYKEGRSCADCRGHCKNGTLCTNPCPVVNKYSNCDNLVQKYPKIYCTKKDVCRASCECADTKLYKTHPVVANK